VPCEAVTGPKTGFKTGGAFIYAKNDKLLHDMELCLKLYQNFVYSPVMRRYASQNVAGIAYCNATFDSFLCWPPTPAGGTTNQNCPAARLSDTTRQAFRRCGNDGLWLGRRANESDHKGWTNYTPCFPTEVQNLLGKVNDDDNSKFKLEIALRTRYLEIVGFSISLIALLISLFIFAHFNRTNIHRNLFSAMTIQVIIRLPYICEVSYVLLEYAISSMFMWMFIEGLFLHSVVTANVLREKTSQAVLMGIGWGLPVLVTALKAARAALVLLPLLGITNILNMIEPVDGAVWKFALWCYVTHFLRSFQGFFIALIYCFMNSEVSRSRYFKRKVSMMTCGGKVRKQRGRVPLGT
ncbi:Uncharacterized protein OBRU01_06252, partial [Operophtera brumata]